MKSQDHTGKQEIEEWTYRPYWDPMGFGVGTSWAVSHYQENLSVKPF